jgi:hypothetical protein
MADGSFAVWDPARNAWRLEEARDSPERISPYVFSSTQIWGGLPNPDLNLGMLCNGLIQDWGNWQREKGSTFEQLKEVLKALSPSTKDEDLISPGPLVDLRVGDTQQYPSILMPDGTAVPVVHASSGVKRILSISYLLIWVWQEHVKASRLLGACCLNAKRPQATIFDLRRQRCARHLLLIVEPFHVMGSLIPPTLWVGGMLPIL